MHDGLVDGCTVFYHIVSPMGHTLCALWNSDMYGVVVLLIHFHFNQTDHVAAVCRTPHVWEWYTIVDDWRANEYLRGFFAHKSQPFWVASGAMAAAAPTYIPGGHPWSDLNAPFTTSKCRSNESAYTGGFCFFFPSVRSSIQFNCRPLFVRRI